MWGLENWDWELDGWIIAAGVLSAVSASLLGNFLVLRRMSMLGDAISHAILPGLAAAFFLSGSRSSLPMFFGAVFVGVLTALFTEWIRGSGKVDEGASMGVVFTSLFALGLVMIVQAADHVDLDPGCVLYGAIELTPLDRWDVGGWSVPRVVVILSGVTLLNLLFVVVLLKELKISSFDASLSTTMGFNARLLHYLLMTLVAVTAVASFESVGNILVVAMFVVPPAAAYLLTDRLGWMIGLSVLLAALAAVLGHVMAITFPVALSQMLSEWIPAGHGAEFEFGSTSTAGMMAMAAGMIFLVVALFAPRQGVLVKWVRRQGLSWQILGDDVLALMFRVEERKSERPLSRAELADVLLSRRWAIVLVLAWHGLRKGVERRPDGYHLTRLGRHRARALVRSHRLWEQYLVSQAGLSTERIHDKAEQLEHFTDQALRDRLDAETDAPHLDPHGRPIPRD